MEIKTYAFIFKIDRENAVHISRYRLRVLTTETVVIKLNLHFVILGNYFVT